MTVAEWGLRAALIGGMLALATHMMDRALARFTAPRRWAWLAGLLLSILIPILGATRVVPPRALAHSSAAPLPDAPAVTGGVARSIGKLALPAVRADTWIPAGRREQNTPLTTVWLLSSLALAIVLIGAARRTNLARRHWRPSQAQGVAVLVSEHVGPAVVGVIRPRIVLPRWVLALDPTRLHMILMHEREHIASRDLYVLAIGCACLVAMPWNPAVWYFVWRLRERIELDCDRRVLSAGVPARSYGDVLLQVATVRRPSMIAALALSNAPSLLERRLKAMTTAPKRNRAKTASLASLAAALLVVLACDTSRRTMTLDEKYWPPFEVKNEGPPVGSTSILIRRGDSLIVPGAFLGDTTELARVSAGTAMVDSGKEIHVLLSRHAKAIEVPLGSTTTQGPWTFVMVRRSDGNLVPGIWRGPSKLMQRSSGATGIMSRHDPRVTELVPHFAKPDSIGGRISSAGATVSVVPARGTERPSRVFVPLRAMLERDGRVLVFRARDGRAEWVYITVGKAYASEAEVLPDPETHIVPIKPGDSIIVAGHLTMTHHAPVRVVANANR